jgi:DNA-binding SARP family transcriptional activator
VVNPIGGRQSPQVPAAGRFRILGPVEAWNGEAWVTISAAKERALLAVLLLHPRQPVSAGQLVTELWGDHVPARPLNSLSVYVHHLRRLIGDRAGEVLVTRAPGYQAALGPGDLDYERFTALAEDGRRALAGGDPQRATALLAEALSCWRGPALADVQTPLVSAEADRLELARVEARKLRAEADLACGRAGEVLAEIQRLLADHPLREEFWVLLMRALQRAGRQAEALEAYDKARRLLVEELGADPGAELRQLYHQILNASVSRPWDAPAGEDEGPAAAPVPAAPPAQLPADIADFTGRAAQVSALTGLLSEADGRGSPGAVRVVVVTGSGGLGKTTLAVHAAHLLADQFPDGQLYADLHGATQPADPAEVLARFLRDLGMDGARVPVSVEERAAQYRTRLAGRRVLIVLDDARDVAQVRPLLPGAASAAVLVTARGRLPELAGSKVIDLEVLPVEDSYALLRRIVGEARGRAEPEATGQVLAACAGLPLAIRIAGARLAARRNWSVATLAARLADERGRLDELQVGELAVRASFEVSFAALPQPSPPGQVAPARAFRLLGLWTGATIGLPAAAALLGVPVPAAEEALGGLLDAHLLESPAPDRYRFHDLLRVYAADRARTEESGEERQAAITRVLSWYLHSTEAAARVISPQYTRVPLADPPAGVRPLEFASLDGALAWCEDCRAELLAAVRLAAAAGLHMLAWQIAASAMSFYYRRSHWTDWVATHQTGLASARSLGSRPAEAWILTNLGMAYAMQRIDDSIGCFEKALAIYRELSDLRGEGRAATNAAIAFYQLRRFPEARATAERSLVIQRRAGKRYGEGIALDILGSSCARLGEFTLATGHLNQALLIFRELGEQDYEAETLTDLGEAFLGVGRVGDAVDCLKQSLAIRQKIGDRHGQAATLRRLGQAQQRAGQARQARELLAQALRLFQEIGDHAQVAEVRAWLQDASPA